MGIMSCDEVEFRKKINRKNTIRSQIKEKKTLAAKLANGPECADEYFQVQKDITELEFKLNEL